jgi:hypothetical protein
VQETEAWKEHEVMETGEYHAGFANPVAYVEAAPPAGLGTEMEVLWRLCRDDDAKSILTLWEQRPVGTNQYTVGTDIIGRAFPNHENSVG